MKTKTMAAMSLLLVLGIAWPARADDGEKSDEEKKPKFGVGVSFSPFRGIFVERFRPLDLADIRVPIFIGSHVKLEPEIGILRMTETVSGGDFLFDPRVRKETFTQLRLALGGYYRHSATEKLEIYVGPRVGIIRSTESIRRDDDEDSETLKDLLLGAALGGEYFFSNHFSLGGEVQFNYLSFDETEDPFSRTEASLLTTNASVLLRFYF
jgi:hypothetical protein